MTKVSNLVESKMLINGVWRGSKNGKVIEIKNMFNQEIIGTVPAATIEDAQDALNAAQEGAKKWGKIPTHERVRILKEFSKKIQENAEELTQLLSAENGKIIKYAKIEVEAGARVIDQFAEESKRLFGQTIPLEIQEGLENDLMITKREPLGVMVGIIPFNFPIELFAHKVGAALAAGNSIIVKPPEDDSLSAIKLVELAYEAGVPGNVLQVVTGYGSDIGDYLAKSDQINGISFTGSSSVGKQIGKHGAENLVRVFLELSGNDAVIFCEDTDIDEAVQHTLEGRLAGNGQVCIATKRILVEKNRYEEFKNKLVRLVSEMKYGNQLDENTDLGPLINFKAAKKVERQIQHAISQGANLLVGGKRDGAFIEPTILEVTKEMDVSQNDEIFGPVFSIMPFDDFDEAIEIANNSLYGLNSAIYTNELNKAIDGANRIEAGLVSINGSNNYRPDVSAFGGYKHSGIGREGINYTLGEFTQIKSIALRGVNQSFS
ncbi:aldehyde dehydrogenase [Virgibacillus sp. CBA3643]|uniref:aldehyde dehydrogenase family protein n=1 Tax=Virgibacillus sp. CBA3643 TaxID=2942278 RepID=UPI0035A27E87